MATWKVAADYLGLPGDNLLERLSVARDLIRLLRSRVATAPTTENRTAWTRWVKTNLHEAIDPNSYIVSPSDSKTTKGEYLTLDISVEEREYPRRVLLAVESELDNRKFRLREIIRDFEKLLAVKAAYKLLIFSSQRERINRERTTNGVILKEVRRGLDCYGHHLRGETYTFIDYNEDSGSNGSCIAHIWQPRSNGPNTAAELIRID